MFIARFALALIFAGISHSVSSQTMYRCGNSYSQTPCGSDANKVDIVVPQGSGGQPARRLKDDATEETKARTVELCKAAVLARLKDPESARFSGISRSNSLERPLPVLNGPLVKTSGVNGYINAKNSMGGYTGDKLFFCAVDYATETKVLDVSID
jgi:hypothetical protein